MAATDAMSHRDTHPVHEELGGYEGAKLGMWLFLATELLLFGVLFAGFALFHAKFPDAFKLAHNSLDWKMGGINTLILILSSLTVALSLDRIQRGKRKQANFMLFTTIFLASGFLVVKYFEYTGKFAQGIFPGDAAKLINPATGEYAATQAVIGDYIANTLKLTDSAAVAAKAAEMSSGVNIFFSFYFIMTGIHGLHVVIGMSVLGVIWYYNANGRYTHWYYTPVECGALYWHLVDLIWIYLFPLFYLIK